MALNCLKRLNKSGIVDKIQFAIYNEYNKGNTETPTARQAESKQRGYKPKYT